MPCREGHLLCNDLYTSASFESCLDASSVLDYPYMPLHANVGYACRFACLRASSLASMRGTAAASLLFLDLLSGWVRDARIMHHWPSGFGL